MTYQDFIREWQSAEPYVNARTSGSTGRPKDIRLLKTDMLCSARATNDFFGIVASSMLVCPLSLDYIAGKMMAVRALTAGCRIEFVEPTNDLKLPGDTPVDLLPVVPSQLASLLARPVMLARVRNLLIGGAAPSVESCMALSAAGVNAFISYGMTETCSHVALARADDVDRVYRAMPGVTFATDDDSRLIICASAFSFRRLQTNDIVALCDSTSFRWLGRADNVINTGGIKLFAEQLEALYAPYMGGTPFYVTSVPDEKWGQAVLLVAETTPCELESIRQSLASEISNHHLIPKQYRAVETLPRTSNGKPRRI